MNFSTYVKKKISGASQTLGAINTLGEYIGSKFTDLANFVSGTGQNIASILIMTDSHLNGAGELVSTEINKAFAITKEIYDQATDNPNQLFNVRYNDLGDTMAISGQAITDACNDMLGELKAQEQFIAYALKTENCDSTNFITRVRALAPNIPGIILDKFAGIIESSGSPIECIKNFLESITFGAPTYENQYIELIDPNAYVGNVWLATITKVGNTIASFFEGAWQGLSHLKEFFQNVLEGVKNLVKWGFNQLFGHLLTNYEKGCSAPIGIMDMPLIQLSLSPAEIEQIGDAVAGPDKPGNALLYSYDFTNHCVYRNTYDAPWEQWGSILKNSVPLLVRDEYDGHSYDSVTEVILPSYPFDMSMRIGKVASNTDNVVLSIYPVADYGTWSKYSDQEIQPLMFTSLYNIFQHVSSIFPMFKDALVAPYDVVTPFRRYARFFFDDSDDYESNLELPQRLKTLGKTYTQFDALWSSASDKEDVALIINSLLSYALIMSKGKLVNGVKAQDEAFNEVITGYIFGPYSTFQIPSGAPFSLLTFVSEEDTLSAISSTSYKPYAKRCQLPVTIHYQTLDDRVNEILAAIKQIIVAVVVVVATVKFMKWSRQRKKDSLLAHAAVDKLSWDVAADPSNTTVLANFDKAYKKMIRMDFVNGLLGISDGSAGKSILSSLKSLGASVGNAQQTSASTVNSKISRDVNPELEAIKSKVNRLEELIYGPSGS